jgi:uncharacterized repeat protein (TIGR01451 family)
MRPTALALLAITLVAFGHAGASLPSGEGAIRLRVVAETEEEIVKADGEIEVRRVEAAAVVPGSEVIYTIYYTNISKKPADNIRVTNPLPEHMVYVDWSAEGEGTVITFSVDGGHAYAAPDRLTVVDEDGERRPAEAADYTHIQWTLTESLEPEEGGHVSFRARLE